MANSSVAPRCAALVGPYLSGKTTLLEALLFASGTTSRRGTIKDGNTVGDGSSEARARQMSTEVNVAAAHYLGDPWTFIDCPGSIELTFEAQNALLVADVAVVVCEPETDRALTLGPLFKFLDDRQIPHMVFINKMDTTEARVRDVLAALQGVSNRPLVLRQVPLRGGDGHVEGYVDLVSERAYRYKPGQPSDLVKLPDDFWDREAATRSGLLEKLADFDDTLLEDLLSDVVPSKEEIYRHLANDLSRDLIVPVFLGAAQLEHGVRRLLKALRHETPTPAQTAARVGLGVVERTLVHVFKTAVAPHTGKLSLSRVWGGSVAEGAVLNGVRVGGVFRLLGSTQTKLAAASTGEVVGLARMEGVGTGILLTETGAPPTIPLVPLPRPVYGLAIAAERRNDDVKLSSALAKLVEEDPTLHVEHNPDTGEMVLWGQGDIHLQIAFDRLRTKYHLAVTGRRPQVPYKETIRKGTEQHTRFKRQSGGHGQFADIHIDVRPLPRGGGLAFTDTVVGGAIPRNYIPSVEEGVMESFRHGTLGFPVVDVTVNLRAGQFHAVDSSDMAFKTCARMAMSEALPKCDPMLLEPIHEVQLSVPNAFTAKVQRLVSGRRGHILGFDAKPDWAGWDVVSAHMPASELHDLIVELRSITMGIGTFIDAFDHLQELSGKPAERVMAGRTSHAAQ